uniref:CCHC-type domain-containing protein n=1 Tax=Oryzias latipes TaxID=8090 RepID=A0A3P9L044_ORYLA
GHQCHGACRAPPPPTLPAMLSNHLQLTPLISSTCCLKGDPTHQFNASSLTSMETLVTSDVSRNLGSIHSSPPDHVIHADRELFRRLDGLTQTLMDVSGQLAPPATAASLPAPGNIVTSASGSSPENFRIQPEPFFGDVEACGGFLLQCRLLFQQAPRYYLSDHSKITLIVNSLRNKALQWAKAFLAVNPITHLTFERFINEFQLVFDQPKKQEEATRKLLALKQRNRPVSDQIIDFRILAVEAGWSDLALKGVFYQSLNENIKDNLCTQPETYTFEELVTAALRSDARLRERHRERPPPSRKSPIRHSQTDEPMQVGHSRLTPEERQRRREEGACFYCGKIGHQVNQCRARPRVAAVDSASKAFLHLPVKLVHVTAIIELRALIDSGAEQSLIDHSLVSRLGLSTEKLQAPVKATGLGGQLLSIITHCTEPVQLITSGNHREDIRFFVTHSPQNSVVLGSSWLQQHNPQFDWSRHTLSKWSDYCLANCLKSAVPAIGKPSVIEPEKVDLSHVPECYHDLRAVFSKAKANSLPPHRPYDYLHQAPNQNPHQNQHQDLHLDPNQDLHQNQHQDLHLDPNQDLHQNQHQDLHLDPNQDLHQNQHQDPHQNQHQDLHLDPNQDLHQNQHQDLHLDPNQDLHQNQHQDLHLDPNQDLHQNQHQDPHQNQHQDPHQNQHQDPHQNQHQDLHQDPCQDLHQDPCQDLHQDPHQDSHPSLIEDLHWDLQRGKQQDPNQNRQGLHHGSDASEASNTSANCKRTRKFGVISRSSFHRDQQDGSDPELLDCVASTEKSNLTTQLSAARSHNGVAATLPAKYCRQLSECRMSSFVSEPSGQVNHFLCGDKNKTICTNLNLMLPSVKK